MKKFKINELLKKIIMINSNIKAEDKKLLIENVNYEKVTSLEALKIIEGILNYGVLLKKEQLKGWLQKAKYSITFNNWIL